METGTPLQAEIPAAEADNLLMTFADALEMADQGDADGGQDLLAGGLARAEDLAANGEKWGETLAARYRDALARFTQQCGVIPAWRPPQGVRGSGGDRHQPL